MSSKWIDQENFNLLMQNKLFRFLAKNTPLDDVHITLWINIRTFYERKNLYKYIVISEN